MLNVKTINGTQQMWCGRSWWNDAKEEHDSCDNGREATIDNFATVMIYSLVTKTRIADRKVGVAKSDSWSIACERKEALSQICDSCASFAKWQQLF